MPTFDVLPVDQENGRRFSELVVRVGQQKFIVHIPVIRDLVYSVTTRPFKKISFESENFEIRRRGLVADIFQRLRLILLVKNKRKLKFDAFVVSAHGPKISRKIFYAVLKRLQNTGFPLDGSTHFRFPEILNGWNEPVDAVHTTGSDHTEQRYGGVLIAIVVHMYYRDVWPQVAAVLRKVAQPFDLIVTTTPGNSDLAADIRKDFPKADIHVFSNRGRDVRPFLMLLEDGYLDRYKYVCKIHGKKSNDHGRDGILGDVWRNQLFFDLLAAPGTVDEILGRFEADTTLGIIGSEAYRFPNIVCETKHAWGKNRELVEVLAQKLGNPEYDLDFFAGTMFWMRPGAMNPLRELALSSEFPEERGLVDGALEHAVERLFTASAKAAGLAVQSVNPASATQ